MTQNVLKEYVAYDRSTGVFYHKKDSMARKVGDIAGGRHSMGYITLSIDSELIQAHRAAWLYVFGYLPEIGLDHINGDKKDNRIENLREVSQSCNMKNCGNNIVNTSGVRGVYRKGSKWSAVVIDNKERHYLGSYETWQEAAYARYAAEQQLGWHECNRETPAKQFVVNDLST